MIHLKILPGASLDQVERAARLATRISINLEAPQQANLSAIAPEKRLESDILPLLFHAGKLVQNARAQGDRTIAPAGVTSQFMVGPGGESDHAILQRVSTFYTQKVLHHAHFSPFYPIYETPLESEPPTPMLRAHRLYQADYLLRQYGFQFSDLSFDDPDGARDNLPLAMDPKLAWALAHPENFPVEITTASYRTLLRIPGIGPKAARTLVQERRHTVLRTLFDLKKIGVSIKRAQYFIQIHGGQPCDALRHERERNLGILSPSRLHQLSLFAPPPATGACSPGAFR